MTADSTGQRHGARESGHPASVLSSALSRTWHSPRALRPAPFRQHQYLQLIGFVALAVVIGETYGGSSPLNEFNLQLWMAYSVAAVGFYWVFGLAGRFAFCTTLMMELGGYLSAWVTLRGWPVVCGLLIAAAGASLLALAADLLLHRSSALFFGIGTLALYEIGGDVFNHWSAFTGPSGTTIGIPPLSFFGFTPDPGLGTYFALLAILCLVLLFTVWIARSPLKRLVTAGRDLPVAASVAGVRVRYLGTVFFMLGSAAAGLSGALIGHMTGVVSTSSYGLSLAIGIFLMLILGGSKSMWGPVVGAAFYVFVPLQLSFLTTYESIVYGLLLLATLIVLPDGIVGIVNSVSRSVLRGLRRRGRAIDAAG
jgi:branched-chain amino acid transport system permease protein